MTTGGDKRRRLASWIQSYEEYSSPVASPLIFRKWAAISAIASALERKVWVRVRGMNAYPNMYIFLVGGPGVGKTASMTPAKELLESSLDEHHIAPTSLTKASLVDTLHASHRKVVMPGNVPPFVEFHALSLCISEFSAFVSSYDDEMMSTLTDLYDGGKYGERRRSRDVKLDINHPYLNIIAGTTPSQLNGFLPTGAWDRGFMSRSLIVYSGDRVIQDLFEEKHADPNLGNLLSHDLKIIGDLYGKCEFSPEAAKAIGDWHMAEGPPAPQHPKLKFYNTRRTAHLVKLCIVSSVDRGNTFSIEYEDFDRALGWLLDSESRITDMFREMNTGGDMQIMEETWHFVFQVCLKENGRPLSEARLTAFVSSKTPAHNVDRLIQLMVKSNMLGLAPGGYVARDLKTGM